MHRKFELRYLCREMFHKIRSATGEVRLRIASSKPVDDEISRVCRRLRVVELDLGFCRVGFEADELGNGIGPAQNGCLRAESERQRINLNRVGFL